jgi:hypothetical protein
VSFTVGELQEYGSSTALGPNRGAGAMSKMSRAQLLTLAEASNEPFDDEEEFQRVETLAMQLHEVFRGKNAGTCCQAFFMAMADEMARMNPDNRRRTVKLCKWLAGRMMASSEALVGLQQIADEQKACH